MTGVIAQAQSDPEIARALREQWLAPRRAVSKSILRKVVKSGELRSDTDIDVVVDQLFAPLYHRMIFGLDPYTPAATKKLVDNIFDGIEAT